MTKADPVAATAQALRKAAAWMEDLMRLGSAGGLLLIAAACVALLLANSPAAGTYRELLDIPFAISAGAFSIDKPLLLWINDGLMAIFFLLVALEIKREVVSGQLSSRSQLALPVIAALGGAVVPALIYAGINHDDAEAMRGWAIPTATDIAFALGMLSLLGRRVPLSIKLLLSTIAVIDDLLAILIIAVFYTSNLAPIAIVCALALVGLLVGMNRLGVKGTGPYLLVGALLWMCVLKSGVHATLAGVVVGLCIPADDEKGGSPLERLEHRLQPWVAYGILPLFAFANAGVPLPDDGLDALLHPVPLGITLGLLLGKPLGVFGGVWLATRLRWLALPEGLGLGALFGVSALCGIGFTMSLFIGSLAFESGALQYAELNRIGILAGSVIAAIVGLLWLRWRLPLPNARCA
ncbi:MAG: Na+/H+ antiporter NhaA [Xanthomonadales bacterium]|nr:Na+/H+ antiporter NhaA [Xanthomonadales bacterium]